MAVNVATLGIKVSVNQALIGLKRLDNKLNRIGLSSSQVGKKLSTFGKIAGLAIGGIGISAIKTAGDFEASMNKVSAIGGHTGKTLLALEDQARELGRTTKFSASQASEGMTFLAMAGYDAQQTMEAMPGILNLAAASSTDLATSADIASNILSGLGLKASDTGKLVDVMALSTASANMNVIELGEAMKMASPMAKTAGLSMQGMTAIIGKMADAGIKGTMAGTSLRQGIIRLLKPTAETSKALDGLEVSVFKNDGTMRKFIDILSDLETAGASATDMVKIFGARSGPALMASMSKGAEGIKQLRTELESAGGSAERMAETQMKGLNGAILKMKSAWEGLMITFGKSGLLDAVTEKVAEITEYLGKKETIEDIKEFGKGVLTVGRAMREAFKAYTSMPEWMQSVGVIMAFLGGKKAKLIVASLTALAWGIGKIGDAIFGVGEKAKDVPDLFGEGSDEVRALRYEIKKLGEQAQVLKATGMFQGVKLDAEAIQPTFNSLAHQMAGLAKQADDFKAKYGNMPTFDNIVVPTDAPIAKIGIPTEEKKKELSFLDDLTERWGFVKEGIQEYIDTNKSAIKEQRGLTELGVKVAQTLEDAFVKMAMGVKVSFKDMARSIMADFLRLRIKRQLASFMDSMFNAGAGTGGKKSWSESVVSNNRGTFTEIPKVGFAGGGFTGSGGRSGGVDGKGGFNAILHPNETVIDHTKGQSQGQTVIVNYSPQVNALDPRTAQMVIAENAQTIVGVVRQAFNRNGQQVAI